MVTLFQALLLVSVLFLRVALLALILCRSFPEAVGGIDFFFLILKEITLKASCQV